jgi:hypothetical protein
MDWQTAAEAVSTTEHPMHKAFLIARFYFFTG